MVNDEIKRYVNLGITSLVGAFLIFTALLLYILIPIFHNPTWVILGTYLWFFIFILVFVNRLSPLYLKIKKDELIFIGYPWVYKVKRDMLNEIIVEPTGIKFKPKKGYKRNFRWVPNVPSDKYTGYKVIKFANYRAIGAIIEAMQPITGVDINWDKISPKWREYLQKKIYSE